MSQIDPERAAELGGFLQGVGAEAGGYPAADDQVLIQALLKDDNITKELLSKTDPHALKKLLPALSHLIRTSNINNEKTLLEMKLNWAIAVRYALFINNEIDADVDMSSFYAWLNFGYSVVEDARKGWRGNLVTNKVKTYKIEGAAKQGGWLSFIRR